ncbi:hypothetical protein GQ600_25386 [Phytophthora cactorum]|nr:hypothetical protein GQ600_25386 [Phytophthora cactorum]
MTDLTVLLLGKGCIVRGISLGSQQQLRDLVSEFRVIVAVVGGFVTKREGENDSGRRGEGRLVSEMEN